MLCNHCTWQTGLDAMGFYIPTWVYFEEPTLDSSQSSIFRKIVEIERSALRAAILHECQNYSPRAINPGARLLDTFENQDSRGGKTRYI